MRIVIIGAGIFGTIISESLRQDGHDDVTVVDNAEKYAGSGPSACLMKPGWFQSMGAERYEPSLELLEDCFGIQDVKFQQGDKTVTVHKIDPYKAKRLTGKYILGKVTEIWDRQVTVETRTDGEYEINFDHLVVAAGVWCNELLLLKHKIRPMAGLALRAIGRVRENRIDAWAPYKQLVGFQEERNSIWIGDGSSILSKNWTQDRAGKTLARCRAFMERIGADTTSEQTSFGYRPYVKEAKTCYFEKVRDRVWVATGGAKNGTIAAGWCAHLLRREFS